MMSRKLLAVAVASTSLIFAACGSDKNAATPGTVKAPAVTAAETPAAAGDIVAVASGNKDFSTLVAAVGAAGLVETLQGTGPFTVFAPTNEAFAALPAGLVDKLLLPANKAVLAQILTYHVVAGKVMAADVKPGDVPTVETSNIAVTIVGGKVMLNETTTVTATDIAASNGVIHVIDSVLLPPGLDISTL
jgi:uncharacterized surface protein with fasciclin (FAS1) repeats